MEEKRRGTVKESLYSTILPANIHWMFKAVVCPILYYGSLLWWHTLKYEVNSSKLLSSFNSNHRRMKKYTSSSLKRNVIALPKLSIQYKLHDVP